MTVTTKPSPLESLLIQDTLLFKEIPTELAVEIGQVHSSPKDNDSILLLELFDGHVRMMGFLLEVFHPHGSVQSRSHLDTLHNREFTGIHIQSARVCLYRQGDGLCPILFISQYQPIQNKDADALTKKTRPIQYMPLILDWLSTLERCGEEAFLSKVDIDSFWDCYLQELEPCLRTMTADYRAAKYSTMAEANVRHSKNRQPSTLQSIDLAPPSPQYQPKLPPSKRTQHALLREYSSMDRHYPTMTWSNIQKHIQDTFDNGSIDDDHFMNGYLPLAHALLSKKTAPSSDEALLSVTPPTDQPSNDWWKVFMKIHTLPTQLDQEKKLNRSKMEMLMNDAADLVLD